MKQEIREAVVVACAQHPAPDSAGRRLRLDGILASTLRAHQGGVVEIGGYKGESTVIMARMAADHGRRVLVVDPWNGDTMFSDDRTYQEFLRNTAEFSNIDICREKSQSVAGENRIIEARPIAFGFVDGLHEFEACLCDLRIMSMAGAELICVDDMNREDMRAATAGFLTSLYGDGYEEVLPTGDRIEAYYARR